METSGRGQAPLVADHPAVMMMGSGQKHHEDQVGTEWVAVRGYPNTLVRKQRGLGEYEGPLRPG